jgi:hypothetical protein
LPALCLGFFFQSQFVLPLFATSRRENQVRQTHLAFKCLSVSPGGDFVRIPALTSAGNFFLGTPNRISKSPENPPQKKENISSQAVALRGLQNK